MHLKKEVVYWPSSENEGTCIRYFLFRVLKKWYDRFLTPRLSVGSWSRFLREPLRRLATSTRKYYLRHEAGNLIRRTMSWLWPHSVRRSASTPFTSPSILNSARVADVAIQETREQLYCTNRTRTSNKVRS